MSHFNSLMLIQYQVSDWERAKKFYSEVLEWPVSWASDDAGWIQYGPENGAQIALNRWTGPGPLPSGKGGIAVLTVEDAHAVTADLRARGVRCDDVVVIPGMVTYGTLYDPDGNGIQFVSSEPPAGQAT